MPLTVKKIVLWRTDVENKAGSLAATLEGPARAGADLKIVMGYRHPDKTTAAIELYPIAGRKAASAARNAGLEPSAIPALLVEGPNKPGLGYAIASAVAGSGVSFTFFVAHVIGRTYSAVMGFENEEDARKATPVIKKGGGG